MQLCVLIITQYTDKTSIISRFQNLLQKVKVTGGNMDQL
jgi:hypothetical protein